jgi:chitosanase
MLKLIVTANKLNKRRIIPSSLPDKNNITGVVNKGFIFLGEEVTNVPNAAMGKWYRDRDNNFYWGGALNILEDESAEEPEVFQPDNTVLEHIPITPVIKRKIEQVINVFETGSASGNYASISKHKDYKDPQTGELMVQVTYGRSQTTEFGHLKTLVQDYVESSGMQAGTLRPYLSRIGKKPSLATDDIFCNALKEAGKNDPVMKICQDRLFDAKYYQPAYGWFSAHAFTLPLSLLVIYDSWIHSGGILPFLRKRFSQSVPSSGGNEKEWISSYVKVRHNWLAGHSNEILRKTIYRTECFRQQIDTGNWDLSKTVMANKIPIG